MAASMNLCERDDVEDWLNIDDTAGDDTTRITRLIAVASEVIENYCDRLCLKASRAYIVDGTGNNYVILPNLPCYPSESITIEFLEGDGTTWTAQTLLGPNTSGPDVDAGLIVLRDGVFPAGVANVRVTLPTGLAATTAALPEDLQQAAIEMVEHLWSVRYQQRGHLYENTQSVGDGESLSFRTHEMPDTVKRVLDRKYRRTV